MTPVIAERGAARMAGAPPEPREVTDFTFRALRKVVTDILSCFSSFSKALRC